MIEIAPRLYVGSALDYDAIEDKPGWYVVQAAKEPYHRAALGYRDRAAPKDHPEYLVAKRGNRLILNIVDADDPAFFRDEAIDQALTFIHHHLRQGRKVLVHCNQGGSRAPSIAMLYLHTYSDLLPEDFTAAEVMFRERMYPEYAPKAGIRGYVLSRWDLGVVPTPLAPPEKKPARQAFV